METLSTTAEGATRRAYRLARLFHRKAGEGRCAKAFASLPPPLGDRLRKAALLMADEAPIVACAFSDRAWVLLTTERLIWQKRTYRAALPLGEISRAEVMANRVNGDASEPRSAVGRLRVVTDDGRVYGLDLEAGPACFGFRHVLKVAARRPGKSSAQPARDIIIPPAPALTERIRKLFGQWSKAGHDTQLVDRFPGEVQAHLAAAAGLATDERPLVACYFSEAAWTLLTETRLVWRQGGRQATLAWEELIDVQELQRPIRPDQAHARGTTSALQVVTRDGHAYTLELEPGPPFFGFWTALKMIARTQQPV